MRQRDPREEVAGRPHERDRERIAVARIPRRARALPARNAGGPTIAGASLGPRPPRPSFGENARSSVCLNVAAVTGSFEGGEKRKPGADAEGVGAPVRGDPRHRGRDLGPQVLAGRAGGVGIAEQVRARRLLELLVRGRVRDGRVEGDVLAGQREAQLGPACGGAAAAAPARFPSTTTRRRTRPTSASRRLRAVARTGARIERPRRSGRRCSRSTRRPSRTRAARGRRPPRTCGARGASARRARPACVRRDRGPDETAADRDVVHRAVEAGPRQLAAGVRVELPQEVGPRATTARRRRR